MNPANRPNKAKKIILFSLILLTTAGIASYLVAILLQKEEFTVVTKNDRSQLPKQSASYYDLLLSYNDLLTRRLNALQQLDQQYVDLLTKTNDKKALDSANRLIHAQEEIFRGTIDSIFLNTPVQTDTVLNNLLIDNVTVYKNMLQNRPSISSLRNAINQDKKSLNPDEMTSLKIQNELQEKNNRIASLESSLKVMSASRVPAATAPSLTQQPDKRDENIVALKENIAQQENKITTLTTTYSSLRQDYDKLIKQQNDAAKTSGTADVTFKNKATSLQQKIDELNAELRLAQVDCNLSRVDAGQIISNSRQRKELLSEASGILTSLAKSEDADIRKKVQLKIARLNQVAANTRD
ncbi:MAG: hypothetical protein ABIQ31_27375 [Ferruginibacter sp.]